MLKKITCILFVFILGINLANAKPVSSKTAQKVAENFYRLNSGIEVKTLTLAYTEFSVSGNALFYVFNINTNDGFVIVTADDVAAPVIGYSSEKNFTIPEKGTTIGNWLKQRNEEISYIKEKNVLADEATTKKWLSYLTYNSAAKLIGNSTTSSVVAPLVQTNWNQSPYYNALCPGNSVTGCVATAMAQIMRYWKYPATGVGSSSYNSNYGPLSVNYGATTYNWANMPLSISSANNDVAVLNYQCGVSVEMNYSPSGSGAYVCAYENPICAQSSYVNYFKYDPTTIQGLSRDTYDDSTWIAMLKSDLDIGRPIQYAGFEANWAGGHTWVCDGYDQNDFFHMNWGWGGQSNGYFSINNLNPSYVFPLGHEAVFGIVPMAANTEDASIADIAGPKGYYCSNTFNPSIKLQNFGSNTLTSCTINYQIDNGTLQTLNWNGSLVMGQATYVNLPSFTSTVGTHSIVCFTSNPNGAVDGNVSNDQSANVFHITFGNILPVVEGFESSNNTPSSDWNILHTTAATDWSVTTSAAATGAKCALVDNSVNTPGNSSILQTSAYYDLSTMTTPAITFKMAYQQKTTTNNDRLQVFVSTDCGASWLSRWARWGSTLPNVSGTTNSFVPNSAQFTTYTVGLNPVATSTHAIFRWTYTSDVNGQSNNIYVDDINIFDVATTTSIQTINNTVDLNLYPNPSTGIVNLDFNLNERQTISINVTDVLGRTIETIDAKNYQAGGSSLSIGAKKTYEAGVYLVNINVDGQIITKKVLIN